MNIPKPKIERIIPVLHVEDLERSVRFYTETLGFAIDWGANEGDTICSVSRDGCCIMPSEGDRGNWGTWVWIGLEDESLFDLLKNQEIRILQEPMNRPWAYEMKIEDIDGNVLWLGTEPRRGEPFAGDATHTTSNQNENKG
jgi:predicted lactoylglutathione lyase